jgi:hypothetical protein
MLAFGGALVVVQNNIYGRCMLESAQEQENTCPFLGCYAERKNRLVAKGAPG